MSGEGRGGSICEDAIQVFRKMSDEEKQKLQTFVIDGMERRVDEIKSRRKKKGDFQYEVSWKNLPSIKYNKWFTREVCFLLGYPVSRDCSI
jgi:hypothetical protein